MAKPRGLGKGLDLMIPNVVGEEKILLSETCNADRVSQSVFYLLFSYKCLLMSRRF